MRESLSAAFLGAVRSAPPSPPRQPRVREAEGRGRPRGRRVGEGGGQRLAEPGERRREGERPRREGVLERVSPRGRRRHFGL